MVSGHMPSGKLICVFTACPVHMHILEVRDHIWLAHHHMPIAWNQVWHIIGVQWQYATYYLFNTKASKASTIQPVPTCLAISYSSLFSFTCSTETNLLSVPQPIQYFMSPNLSLWYLFHQDPLPPQLLGHTVYLGNLCLPSKPFKAQLESLGSS